MTTEVGLRSSTTRVRRIQRRIAIIGGGPAGAHCARRLAESGLSVTLFEACTSREKPCGGGIPARALEAFPFLDDARLPVKRIYRCLLVSPSGREVEFPLSEPLHVFRRADLQAFMLARAVEAGAHLITARVISFERVRESGGDGAAAWLLRSATAGTMRGRNCRSDETAAVVGGGAGDPHGPFDFMVAADGASGGARRRLIGPWREADLTQGIGYLISNLSEDFITLKFFDRLLGYLWVFPRCDHSSAGICGPLRSPSARSLKTLMDRFLRERYGDGTLRNAKRFAALIPSAAGTGSTRAPHGDGWALVGDSGGFVDPLTREGISHAMLSADLLAESLISGRTDSFAASWARDTGREFSWASRHATGFFQPRFTERLVTLCDLSPRVARVMSDLIAGRQSYRSLKRRLLINGPRIIQEVLTRYIRHGRFRTASHPDPPMINPSRDRKSTCRRADG